MCIVKMVKEHSARKKALKLSDLELDKIVKIQGTNFDRKRKLMLEDIATMKKLYAQGTSYASLADMFDVTILTVKYNVDDEWREHYNLVRSGLHTGITTMDFDNRVAYKRDLIVTKQLKLLGV